jgi:hypothetical protein
MCYADTEIDLRSGDNIPITLRSCITITKLAGEFSLHPREDNHACRLRKGRGEGNMMPANDQQTTQQNQNSGRPETPFAIIGVGLANVIDLLQNGGRFNLLHTVAGAILLCILQIYVPESPSQGSLNLAYSAIWSLAVLTTFGVVFNIIFSLLGGSLPNPNAPFTPLTPFHIYYISFIIVWIVITLIRFRAFRQ